jgi:hypothetical protein
MRAVRCGAFILAPPCGDAIDSEQTARNGMFHRGMTGQMHSPDRPFFVSADRRGSNRAQQEQKEN